MTTTTRQTNLILNQDWKTIYQTFNNADFQSYDFENLRRVMITYLRENYPEDFNDYIESSEYMALIDAIAFLGQSLAFRIDLASRENFIELAERKESVLRIARMLSYNAKRNIAGQGLLKFDTVSTTEDVLDSNGRNLASQTIVWNDPTNINWLEQFILVLNSAMADNTEFGRSQGSDTIQGILTEQYRFRTITADVPLYAFSKTVAGRSMAFELVSTSFSQAESIYEEPPVPGNQLGFVYRNDGRGAASNNTGFFLMFKQGSLELADFTILAPTTNEKVAVDSANINNNDVWLFNLDSTGTQQSQWTKVSSLVGNNIAYNSLINDTRNIYSVVTKNNDRIELVFADGVYGNLPKGNFRTYYRVSNGLSYAIAPAEMRGINIIVPYRNKNGVEHSLTISLGLKTTSTTAAASEDIDSIRTKAPAVYYTQNRMITAEDYNLAPLNTSQDILKVKSVNRTSSGISRNFDIIDASGKYSSVNVFADDGYIYKNETERSLSFKYSGRIEVVNFVRQTIRSLFMETDVYNFYLTKYNKIFFTDTNTVWTQVTSDVNNSTGYFKNSVDLGLMKVGVYTTNTLKYLLPGAMIKFVVPAQPDDVTKYVFKRGKLLLVGVSAEDPEYTDFLWTKVVNVVGDGTNAGRGELTNGFGPVSFSDVIPSGAIANRIVPKFVFGISQSLENEIVNLITSNTNFGIRYSVTGFEWKLITASNIDLISNFSLGKTGDVTNTNVDASWIVAFERINDEYSVRIRGMEYVFGSINQNRFYLDTNQKTYDAGTGNTVKDKITVLGINTDPTGLDRLYNDITFEISDTIRYEDGYEAPDQIKVAFADTDDDGVADNPEAFEIIVGEDQDNNYLFFEETTDVQGNKIFQYVENVNQEVFLIETTENDIIVNDYNDGQLIYFSSSLEDRVKMVDLSTNSLVLQSQYRANIGRDKIKFQYIHNANVDRRIDPSASNIIDVYILTKSYDTTFRNYLAGGLITEPTPPDSESLRISFGSNLNPIKSISDEIIYHPVMYKILFGSTADSKFQAVFKVVKNSVRSINDNDLKVRIINAIDEFFDVNNWDFGDRFYVGELTTYILNTVAPDVSNIVIVPRQTDQSFGSLFEIQSRSDEIFVSGATVDDIEIVSSINASEIRALPGSIVNTTT